MTFTPRYDSTNFVVHSMWKSNTKLPGIILAALLPLFGNTFFRFSQPCWRWNVSFLCCTACHWLPYLVMPAPLFCTVNFIRSRRWALDRETSSSELLISQFYQTSRSKSLPLSVTLFSCLLKSLVGVFSIYHFVRRL